MVLVARLAAISNQNQGNVTFTLELKVQRFSGQIGGNASDFG
jgi:hypothetical protein